MDRYRYQHGDRPLEGHTIERAVGRGGFGEVYYAVSDGGREVALKAIQGYEQIELRGVRQCMNLKSPHLVTIFDIRRNEQGQWFVIMEYVAGPSLRDLITQSPGGLGQAKAAYLFREIAKGLSFLHDAGIVHRDLKPGNIFYEDGVVKIGDYGLSKAIAPSRHEGQTITVGTVHYMAPEIGAGCYDRSIDIYALGVVLYEMLTGNVPFAGSSHGEILMKHMTAQPDLAAVAEPMAGVIRKALAKDPRERYATAQEMVEALFGSEELRESVSAFSPASLTMVAGHVAGRFADNPSPASPYSPMQPPPIPRAAVAMETPPPPLPRPVQYTMPRPQAPPRSNFIAAAQPAAPTGVDPLTRRQRVVLAMVAVGTVSVAVGVLVPQGKLPAAVTATPLAIGAGAAALLAALRLWPLGGNAERLIRLAYRAVAAGTVTGVGAMISAAQTPWRHLDVQWPALLVALLLVDWPRQVDARRPERVSLGQVVWAAALALVSGLVFGQDLVFPIAVSAGLSLAVQVLCPHLGSAAGSPSQSAAGEPAFAPEQSPSPGTPATADPAASPTAPPPLPSPYKVSHRKRLPALILALVGLPVFTCGLHRFYVGKIGTGLLWLGTVGLFGVGQIVDIVLILLGRFRDRHGRPLVIWENWSELNGRVGPDGRPLRRPEEPSTSPDAPAPVNALLSAAAGTLMLTAVTLAICAVVVPPLMAAGIFDPALPASMRQEFGDPNWPSTMNALCVAVAAIVGAAGTILLVVARRRAGAAHIVRVFLGAAGLVLGTSIFCAEFQRIRWVNLPPYPRVGQVLTLIVQGAEGKPLIFGTLVLLAALTILAWPPRPRAVPLRDRDGRLS